MDISGNKITNKESNHLTQFLRSSSTLQVKYVLQKAVTQQLTLNLQELYINNTEIRVEFLKEVLKGMCGNPYLVDFHVSFAENKVRFPVFCVKS